MGLFEKSRAEKLARALMEKKEKAIVLYESEADAQALLGAISAKGVAFEAVFCANEKDWDAIRRFNEEPDVKLMLIPPGGGPTFRQIRVSVEFYELLGENAEIAPECIWSYGESPWRAFLERAGDEEKGYSFAAEAGHKGLQGKISLCKEKLQELRAFLNRPGEDALSLCEGGRVALIARFVKSKRAGVFAFEFQGEEIALAFLPASAGKELLRAIEREIEKERKIG